MLLYFSLLGFLISGILLFYNKKKNPASAYLAFFFLLVSLYRLNEYVILYSKSVFWNAIISSNFVFLAYLIGPFLFFYVRSVVCGKTKLTSIDLVHFLPAALFFLALIPYITTPFSYKMEIAQKIVSDSSFLYGFKPTIFSDIFSVRAVYYSRPVSIFAYSVYSIFILSKCVITRNKANLIIDQVVLRWLVFLLFVTVSSFLIHWWTIIYMFGNESTILFIEGELILKLAWLSFMILIISPLLFPKILYGIGATENSWLILEEKSNSINQEGIMAKQASIVDKEYYMQIGILIDEYLTEKKSFINSGYNLTQLAEEIGLPVHHLSYYFREIRQQNFTDYKNELRVKYACELILRDQFKDMTLEAIGEEAGFSSRVTFMRAFKKVTNQTPGNFKISMKQESIGKTE